MKKQIQLSALELCAPHNSVRIVRVFSKIITIALFLLVLAGCSNPADDVLKAVDDGRYIEASSLYSEKVVGNLKEEQKVEQGIKERIDNIISACNDESLSYDDAVASLEWIEKSNVCDQHTIDLARESVKAIGLSKEAYTSGIAYYEAADYKGAYSAFVRVDERDSNYSDAQEKIADSKTLSASLLSDEVDQKVKSGSFLEAKEKIDEALAFWGSTQELKRIEEDYETAYADNFITLSKKQVDQKQFVEGIQTIRAGITQLGERNDLLQQLNSSKDAYVEDILARAKARVGERNYLEAVQLVTNGIAVVGSHDKLSSTYEEYKSLYVADCITRADGVLTSDKGNPDYEGAITIMHEAISHVGEETRLVEKIFEYQEYAPVPLTDFDYIAKGGYISIGSGTLGLGKDYYGNEYSSQTVIYPTAGSFLSVSTEEDEGKVEYLLNSEYDYLEGVLYLPYVSREQEAPASYSGPSTFAVYGDGVKLYSAPAFSRSNPGPLPIQVNISGVRELKICMMGVWSAGWGEFHPMVCANNLTVRKVLSSSNDGN